MTWDLFRDTLDQVKFEKFKVLDWTKEKKI